MQDHIGNLIDLQPARSSADIIGLRRLYGTFQAYLRGLKALHVTEDSFSTVLWPLIFQRLPKDLILEFNRRLAHQDNAATSGDATASSPVSLVAPPLDFLKVELESIERTDGCQLVKKPKCLGRSKGPRHMSKNFIPSTT